MSLSIEQLRDLGQQIASDPDSIYNLDPEQAIEVRKYLNPLGNIVTAKKTYANISLVNWRDKYLRRIHTTALVGYLYRTLEEYEPEEELERERSAFKKAVEGLGPNPDQSVLQSMTREHDARMSLLKSTAQGIVRRFLNRNFNYNPDQHLRGSHSENKSDPERVPKDDAIRAACEVVTSAPGIESKLRSKPEATYKYLRSHLLTTYQATIEATNTVKATIGVILNPDLDNADKQGILIKKYKQLSDQLADMKKVVEPIAAAETLDAWKVNPPVDVFHQFDRYLTNHYEQLREVVQALYNEKPDFEYAAILYDSFKTPEAARDYRVQHENEFRTEVFTIENSAVSLIGPFKENRQRVDFYNKNTEVMKRMMEQLESDHKLGKDLMEKQVRAKKKKNIEEAGPDDPALAAYAKTMNTVQELGAKKILTREEQEALSRANEAARLIKEDYEVPDDAIQVDMFFPKQDESGNTTLEKTKFFSLAEAPLHMQEGSQFNETYQPKRAEGESLTEAYKTKVIVDRNGKKREIKVPVKKSD
jgi:hypothetical protein